MGRARAGYNGEYLALHGAGGARMRHPTLQLVALVAGIIGGWALMSSRVATRMILAEHGNVNNNNNNNNNNKQQWKKRRESAGGVAGRESGKWSDVQRGRRQEYSTLKSRGLAKILDLTEVEDEENEDAAEVDNIAQAIGQMPVVCPFDTTHLCRPNKICPTDSRPCKSSRAYWSPESFPSVSEVMKIHVDDDGVGELGAALEASHQNDNVVKGQPPSIQLPVVSNAEMKPPAPRQSFFSAIFAFWRRLGKKDNNL